MGAFELPFGFTITVQRRTEDGFGNWSTVSTHTISPCGIDYDISLEISSSFATASGRTSARAEGRETVVRNAVLYAPHGADITPTDRIVIADGTVWDVLGDVSDFSSPLTGWKPGITVRMQRSTG